MPEMIELEEVQSLVDEGAQLLDVMSRGEYEDSHLPGAIHREEVMFRARAPA